MQIKIRADSIILNFHLKEYCFKTRPIFFLFGIRKRTKPSVRIKKYENFKGTNKQANDVIKERTVNPEKYKKQ